jgi:hypothetical protein
MSFHVFLSHRAADKPAVEELACRLAKKGIQAWLDKWHLIPDNRWQRDIERALAEHKRARSSSVPAVWKGDITHSGDEP